MLELAYGAIKYFFLKADPDDFKAHYERLGATEILQDAVTISYHHQVRPAIRAAVFDLVGEDIDLLVILSDADGILNFDEEVGLPSVQTRRWLQQDADYSLACYIQPDQAVEPLHRQDLLSRIRKSSPEQFRKIIRFLRVNDDLADNLGTTMTVALAKRLRRALNNDTLYYSILANSVTVSSMVMFAYYLDDEDDEEE